MFRCPLHDSLRHYLILLFLITFLSSCAPNTIRESFLLSDYLLDEKTEAQLQRSLAILEKERGSENPETVLISNILALSYMNKGHYKKAESLLKRSLTINEKVLGPEHLDTVIILENLASLYQYMGLYEKSKNLYQRVLAICIKKLGPEHPKTLLVQNNLAVIYIEHGHSNAEPLLKSVLAISEKKFGYEHPFNQTVHSNLALLYLYLGRYAEAEHLYKNVLRVRQRELGIHVSTANSLNSLAELYLVLGNYDEAEQLFKLALTILKEIKRGSELPATLKVQNNLAKLYLTKKDYEKAEKLYQHILIIREKILGPEHFDLATTLNDLGALYLEQGKLDNVEEILLRALSIYEKKQGVNHFFTLFTLNSLALLYQNQDQFSKAESFYQRSLSIAHSMLGINHPLTAQAVFNYAKFKHEQNQTSSAIFFGKQAINNLQGSRESNQKLNVKLQKSFLNKQESIYRSVADWLLEAGRLVEAEQVLAMLKEEELYLYLRRNQSAAKTLNMRADCSHWEEEHCQHYQRISNNLREVGKALQMIEKQVREEEDVERTRLNELQQLLKKSRMTFDNGLTHINTALSALQGNLEYKMHVEIGVLQRSNIEQEQLEELGHGAVALHYLLMEDGVRVILTTPDKQLTRKSEIKLATLRRKVGTMRQAILRQKEQIDYKALSQELYALLISPIADELDAANAKTLMISLDGILRYLPFSVLHDGKQFLIERYAINMQTLAARNNLKDKPKEYWHVTGFGVSEAAIVTDPLTKQSIHFDPLPFVKNELHSIIRQNDKQKGLLPGEIYLDAAFNKHQLTASLTRDRSKPVVHIGSHFKLFPGDNTRSFLLLGQNAILTMAEVYEKKLNFSRVELVTLSACDTAMGEDNVLSNGAEIESFGVLVQDLGAKSVMATLWPVIDESTSLFMKRFYQLREQNKLTKAEALRQAQLSMITSGDKFSQPYYWAPFVLMGNWL